MGHRGGRRQHPDAGDRRNPPACDIVPMPKLEPSLDLADLLIQAAHACPLLPQGLHHHRRQTLRDPSEGLGHASTHTGPALRHDLAIFGQKASQAVDLRGAELHQLLAHAVQRQDRLLLLGLDRNRLDAGLLHRRPDRACVVRIVLVTAHEGPNHLRWQQPYLVAELAQPPSPVLRTAARLQRDKARRAVGEVFEELRPCQP